MSRSFSKLYITALSCLTAAALVAGCGGDEKPQVTCGEGTQKVGSNCVLESAPVNCGEGTTLTEAGECEPNVACGAGTSADATGACVPDYEELACADGTKLDGTTCVADTDALCEAGTHADNGICVADVVCGTGTTAREGECLSDDDLLNQDADVTEEDVENDLDFDGTAQAVSLPAASETLTIAGTLGAPADKDNDGFADQDFDAYAIEGTSGDYLRLEAIDNGSGAVGFLVQGPQDYIRLSPAHENAGERKVLLPYDGTYTITVGPTSHFLNGTLGARGGDDATYMLAIENLGSLDTSSATAVDAAASESTTGNFADLGDNLVAVSAAADSMVKFSFPKLGIDVNPAVIVLNANGDVLGEQLIDRQGFVRVPAADDDLQLLLDYVVLQGERDTYTLETAIGTPETVTETLSGTKTVTHDEATWVISAGDSVYFSFEVALEDDAQAAVNDGLIQTIVATPNYDVLDYRVYDPNHERVKGFNALSGFHATIGGTYTLELINTDKLRTVELSAIDFASYIPVGLGTFDATTTTTGDHSFATVSSGEFRFLTFDTSEAVSATIASVQNTDQALALYLLTEEMGVFASNESEAPGMSGLPLMDAGRYYGLIINQGQGDAISVNTTLTTSEAPVESSEPNNALADATPITDTDEYTHGTLVGGPMRDYDIFEIATAFTEPTLVEVGTYRMSDAGVISVELRDENGVLYDITDDSSTAYVGAVLQPGTKYYLHVYRTEGFGPLPYLVEVMHNDTTDATFETEGNEDSASASAMATLFNPLGYVGGGTLAGGGDVDWYTFNLPAQAYLSLNMSALGNLLEGTELDMELFEDDGTGTLTPVVLEDLMRLDSGDKYIKISGGTASGYANSYGLRASVVSATDIGVVPTDTLHSDGGTFGSDPTKLFAFEVGANLPVGGSQTLIVWSDAEIEVLDDTMQPIHTATASSEFDGGWVNGVYGAGFSSTTLTAGNYFVRLSGEANADWLFRTGILDSTTENEALTQTSNDTDADAEALGMLDQAAPTHIFGSVDGTDADDWFTVEVPDANSDGTAVNVTFEHMQFGESVSDVDLYIAADPSVQLDFGAYATPQFLTEALLPGVHYINVNHWEGTYSGEYLVRVSLP
jgi:hypothetical protein